MLTDCLAPNLHLVICGTAAGTKSAARGQYYAGPGNKFWKTLYATGLTPRQLVPAEYELLPSFGVGLTDIVKGQAGMDSEIDFSGADQESLEQKILLLRPRILCFNGKKAATIYLGRKSPDYGLQAERIGTTEIHVATSTSGAANGHWNVGTWQEVADATSAARLVDAP